MSFLILIALIVIIWQLWILCRNSGDALDKQTSLQYEIVALEKRIAQLAERFPVPPAAVPEKKRAAPARKRPAKKASPAKKAAPATSAPANRNRSAATPSTETDEGAPSASVKKDDPVPSQNDPSSTT